jgi:cytochrome c oxidase subunit 2
MRCANPQSSHHAPRDVALRRVEGFVTRSVTATLFPKEECVAMTSNPQQPSNRQATLLAGALALLVIFTVTLFVIALRQMPKSIAHIAPEIDYLFRFIFSVAAVIFLLAHVYLFVVVWRFRFRKDAQPVSFGLQRRDWKWVLIPVALILLADIAFDHKSNHIWAQVFWKVPSNALTVEVTGQQFAWGIRYPGKDGKFGRTRLKLVDEDNPLGIDKEDPASADDVFFPSGQGELHVPVRRPVLFLIRSKDVLHSFFVPQARLKMDAVPSMTTQMWFTPTRTGTYEFVCAELCGLGHYQMRGVLVVESADAFESWLSEQATASDMLP